MGELGGLYPLMQDHGIVFMVAGWWGMTDKDVPGLLEGLTSHPGESLRFSDRVHQGMVNQQIDLFLRPDGQIVHTCDGVCDPE